MTTDTGLMVSTDNGVFLLESSGDEPRPLGLEGKGRARWIIVDKDKPARAWVATERDGVWRTDDGGLTWASKNEGLVYKHTLSLAQHPVTGDVYAGTEPACIFRSVDGGDSWIELESLRRLRTRREWTFPGPPYVAHVRGIGLCATDPDTIFGAVEEGWLVRSTDGGRTWINIKSGTEFDSHTVTVLPDDPDTIVSASGKGLRRSEDGGGTFTDANVGIEHPYLINVVVHPDRPRVLYTAGAEVPPPHWGRSGGPGAGFYRSDDGGRCWQRLTGGLPEHLGPAPRSIALSRQDPDTVYVGLNDGEIWMSASGGEDFGPIARGLPAVLGIAPLGTA